jgi:hypothetical protein
MKKIKPAKITNIADLQEKARQMRGAIVLLQSDPDLAFVLVSLVASFIDGLAKGAPGKTREAYLEYLKANFPTLCADVGAEMFYAHIRCASMHEFAPRPPFALARDSDLRGSYAESRDLNGKSWTLLNADRLAADFLAHLNSKYP